MFSAIALRSVRRRRTVRAALIALALAASAPFVVAAVPAHHHGMDMGDAMTICVTIGGCVAAIAVAASGVRRLVQRPLWRIPAPVVPALTFIPVEPGFLIRAGPPDLQVFRR